MKIKTLLKIAIPLSLPAILSLICNMLASFAYWNNVGIETIKTLNHPFIFWTGTIGFFCSAFVIVAVASVFNYADKIDKLEETTKAYEQAKDEMETARDKFTELLKIHKQSKYQKITIVPINEYCGLNKNCDFVEKQKGCFVECNWYKRNNC
jgi:uncharacterized membrane protein